MIPLRLEATNFRGIAHAEIDLTSFDLAAVVGENGAGKSTFFSVGPMFTLFGWLPRGLSLDKMVRTGEQEMATAIDFEHREEIYRVARTYSKKGRGKSTLELQQQVGNRWESLSGTTIPETEEKIKNLLSLDANTFINSSMILQGGANKFTAALPSERKEVLKKVIGLDIYDQLLEAAKKHAARVEQELTRSKEKLAEMDEKLKASPELEQELIDAEADLATVAAEITVKEAELKQAEETVKNLQDMVVKVAELQDTVKTLSGEIENLQSDKGLQETRHERANKMLESESQIIAKAAEYEQIKQQVTVLQAKAPRLEELNTEKNRIGQEMAQTGVVTVRLEPQIREVEDLLKDRAELEKAAVDYRAAMADMEKLDHLAEERNKLNIKSLEAEKKTAEWDKRNEYTIDSLQKQLKEKRQQAALLHEVPCGNSTLSGECPLLKAAVEAQTIDIPRLVSGIDEANAVKNPHTDEWQTLLRDRDALNYDPAEHKRLRALVNELRPKAEKAAQLEAKAQLLETLQEQKKQQEEQRASLARQLNRIKAGAQALAAELEPLAVMEARLPKLELWVKTKEELPAAREIVKTSTETITKLGVDIQAKEEQKKALELEMLTLDNASFDIGTAKVTVNVCLGEIKSLQSKQNELHGKIGGLKIQIEALNKVLIEKDELATKMAPLARELTRWQTLTKAFSRNGIPALIIENAVPELESIASEILGQMTNGQQAIRFETERELKSKDKADTLDIWVDIYDEPEARIYETFSGGEQLRIDFALRFALAELMARRAGAKIEWLTVDEGLGSQGAKHLPLVLEAIKKVAGRFRKTFVITHVKEAQVFEQIITLEKNGVGVEFKAA